MDGTWVGKTIIHKHTHTRPVQVAICIYEWALSGIFVPMTYMCNAAEVNLPRWETNILAFDLN